MTSPLSHKYENYSEPGWLRGDLHSKNNVSKYKQPLILFCKLINNCSQFLRIGCAIFSFSFFKLYI